MVPSLAYALQTSSATTTNKLSGAIPLRDSSKRMKLSQLDYLVNPLRTDHPFGKYKFFSAPTLTPVYPCAETWTLKEMALFSACVCQFGKRFDLFLPLVSFDYEDLIEATLRAEIVDRHQRPVLN